MLDADKLTSWDYVTQEVRDRAGIFPSPDKMGRCFVCGRATTWIDIGYEGWLCSPRCDYQAAEDAAKCSPGGES